MSIFNTEEWVPIDWSYIKNNGNYTFKNLEPGIIYLPAFYSNGTVVAAADPFFLDYGYKCITLKADHGQFIENMSLSRFLPVDPERFMTTGTDGATFEFSNDVNFDESVLIYTQKGRLRLFDDNIVNIDSENTKNQYRYVRYKNPDSSDRTTNTLSEIEFRDSLGCSVPYIISGKNIIWYPSKTDRICSDNDYGTFAGLNKPDSYVVFDFWEKVSIDKIIFSVGMVETEQTKVQDGHIYELLYRDRGKWHSFKSSMANNNEVRFSNIPANTIYMLRDLTNNTPKSQIFRYVNGKQLW